MNELEGLQELLDNHAKNGSSEGTLMVKYGILVLKNSRNSYQTLSMVDGAFRASQDWYDEKQIKLRCMELNPEEYPMAQSIYGE